MTRLNDHGVAHLILILVVIVGTAIGGSYYIMASKADSFNADGTCNRQVTSSETKAAEATVAGTAPTTAAPAAPTRSTEDAECQTQALDKAVANQKIAAAKVATAELAPAASAAKADAPAVAANQAPATNGLSCAITGVPSRFNAGSSINAVVTVKNTGTTTDSYMPLDFSVKKTTAGPDYALEITGYKAVNNLTPGSQQSFSFAIPTVRFMLAKDTFSNNYDLMLHSTSAIASVRVNDAQNPLNCSNKLAFTAVVPTDDKKITLQVGDFVRDNYSQFAAYTVKDRGSNALVLKTVTKSYLSTDSRIAYASVNPTGYTKDRAFLEMNNDKRVRICVSARSDDAKASFAIRSGNFRNVVKPTSSYKDYCFTDKASAMINKRFNDPMSLVSSSRSQAKNATSLTYVRSVTMEIVK